MQCMPAHTRSITPLVSLTRNTGTSFTSWAECCSSCIPVCASVRMVPRLSVHAASTASRPTRSTHGPSSSSCPEFGRAARSKELLLLFGHEEQRWPTLAELTAIECPWRHDGPLHTDSASDSRDFFSRYCGFTPSAEAEAIEAHDAAINAAAAAAAAASDAVSVTSSCASRAVRLARAPQPREVPMVSLKLPTGQEEPVLCIPLSKRVLAIKYGWLRGESESKFQAVRNVFKRRLKKFSIPADVSPEQEAIRARYLAEFKITIQAVTAFVPVAEVDQMQRAPGNAPAAAAAAVAAAAAAAGEIVIERWKLVIHQLVPYHSLSDSYNCEHCSRRSA